jgi:hypothetical protein
MVERTSTGDVPWTLVESNDKNYARVKILRTLCESLEQALEGSAGKSPKSLKATKVVKTGKKRSKS